MPKIVTVLRICLWAKRKTFGFGGMRANLTFGIDMKVSLFELT